MHWCWPVPVCWNKLPNTALPWSSGSIYVILYFSLLPSSSVPRNAGIRGSYFFCNACSGTYLINYLATRGPELQPFVTASLIQLLCRVTKFGWFDDDRFRDLVKESTNFLSQVTLTDLRVDLLLDSNRTKSHVYISWTENVFRGLLKVVILYPPSDFCTFSDVYWLYCISKLLFLVLWSIHFITSSNYFGFCIFLILLC